MLIEVQKDVLMRSLQHVIKAVALNGPAPILQGIHIQAASDRVIFTASNTSMTIQSEIQQSSATLNIKRKGTIVIPSRYFFEVIRKLRDGVIVLELETEEKLMLTIRSGHSNIRLCGMDPTEFPYIKREEEERYSNRLQLNHTLFKATIKQVAVMAATSENRPVLTGVSFESDDNHINIMATDGVRLASRTLHIASSSHTNFKVIVPAKNLLELAKLLGDEYKAIEMAICNNRVKFIANGLKVESALIEGTFPSINNVVPRSYLCEILVDTESFLAAVDCVTVLAGDYIIRLAAESAQLKLLSRTREIGDVEHAVPLLEMRGEQFSISVNGKFLSDMLRNRECTSIRIRYAGQTSPIVILPNDSLKSTFFLLTPVRTQYEYNKSK